MQAIAHIQTDFPQKFGIPRQSGIAASAQGTITFEPAFADNDAVRGIEGFSHLWLIWAFEETEGRGAHRTADASHEQAPCASPDNADEDGKIRSTNAAGTRGWSPTVRPPRLGGNKRLGVFATRSPFRPNAIGLSSVRLDRVEYTDAGPILHVLGADLRDGTPIYDIKPYVPYTDCHADATGGFTDDGQGQPHVRVEFPPELLDQIAPEKRASLIDALAQDPRPASQHKSGKTHRLAFARWDVHFQVTGDVLTVVDVKPFKG